MKLRSATMEDAELILGWRNDDSTRASSFSGDVIALKEHIKWLSEKLSDENCIFYIALDGAVPVGSIRLDLAGNIGEISYMIAPAERGKGYGREILRVLEENLPKGVDCLVGIVKMDNEASRRCFKYNGFSEFFAENTVCYVKTERH